MTGLDGDRPERSTVTGLDGDRPERARLFVALELPVDVGASLGEWASHHVAGVDGLRLVGPEGLHVTLCFLGSQPATSIDGVATTCAALAGSARPVLTVGEPAWLPPRRPGVLVIDLDDQGGLLGRLQSELARALQAGGWYEPERRRFRPHVTVARVGRGTRLRAPELPAPAPISFVGSTVALMRSRLGGSGAHYERLAAVVLGPEAAVTAEAASRPTSPAPDHSHS